MRRFITVPGPPVGKQRARTVARGGKVHSYTPEKTAIYERLIAEVYKFTYPDAEPFSGPVELTIDAYYQIPASWPQSKKAAALADIIKPTVKPDADNCLKAIADSLNGVAYGDDKQVTDVTIRKRYGVYPHVDIAIWSNDPDQMKEISK